MRILFYATSPNQTIGYSKIANKISNFLASYDNIEFYYIATGNFLETLCKDRYINPRIKFIDVISEENKRGIEETDYGVSLIKDIMSELKPDIFLVYNDIIVVCRLFNELITYYERYKSVTKFIVYIDLVYPNEKFEFIEHMDKYTDLIYVFSEYWKQNLITNRVPSSKIKILSHGISSEMFTSIPQSEARKMLNLDKDDFIVLNTNRNCYRKGIDITLRSFIKFFKDENKNKKIKLFLNMYLNTNSGYDIISQLKTECIRYDMDYEDIKYQILTPGINESGRISDQLLNVIYNATDIGINTCFGEGFGLCNFEHAYLQKPQIISAVGGLNDIFSNDFSILIKPKAVMTVPNLLDGHNGDLHICEASDFTEAMKFYYHNPQIKIEHGVKSRQHIEAHYRWDIILGQFSIQLNEFYKRDNKNMRYYTTKYT